jgi:hypothetical protein
VCTDAFEGENHYSLRCGRTEVCTDAFDGEVVLNSLFRGAVLKHGGLCTDAFEGEIFVH